jgi:hypothetical protein
MYEIGGGLPFDCRYHGVRIPPPPEGMGVSLFMFTVCYVGSGLSDGLITRPEESFRLCVSNPVWYRNLKRGGLRQSWALALQQNKNSLLIITYWVTEMKRQKQIQRKKVKTHCLCLCLCLCGVSGCSSNVSLHDSTKQLKACGLLGYWEGEKIVLPWRWTQQLPPKRW